MRCPHCAGEIPDLSRFCGICGRYIDPGGVHSRGQSAGTTAGNGRAAVASATGELRGGAAAKAAPGAGAPTGSSLSLFELPVSRGARIARIVLILALDAILVGAGVAMIVSYLNARDRARGATPEVSSEPATAEVEVLPPEPVIAPATTADETVADGAVEPASGGRARPGRSRRVRATRDEPRSPASGPALATPRAPADATPASAPAASGAGAPGTAGTALDAGSPTDPDAAGGAAGPGAPAATFDAGPAGRDGGGSPAEAEIGALGRKIAAVVEAHKSQLERCYRQAAKASTPSEPLQGRVVIQFGIMPDGRVQNARAVENTSGSERLATCVAADMAGWGFPQHGAEGALEFRWPFVFKAPK